MNEPPTIVLLSIEWHADKGWLAAATWSDDVTQLLRLDPATRLDRVADLLLADRNANPKRFRA